MKQIATIIQANKTRWIPAITAFIAGGITQLITSKGWELPADVATMISTTVALGVGWIFEFALSKLNREGVAAVQEALPGIKPTGTVTSKDVAMVQRLAASIDADRAEVRELSLSEAGEIKLHLFEICRDRPELLAQLRNALQTMSAPKPPLP